MPPDDDDGARSNIDNDDGRGGGETPVPQRIVPTTTAAAIANPSSLPPDGDPVSRRPLPEAPGTGWVSYSKQCVPDMDSMLSFQTYFFFVFL